MNTRGMPLGYRKRVKRATRKLLRTHPADVGRAVRAMDERDEAVADAQRAGWDRPRRAR